MRAAFLFLRGFSNSFFSSLTLFRSLCDSVKHSDDLGCFSEFDWCTSCWLRYGRLLLSPDLACNFLIRETREGDTFGVYKMDVNATGGS